ncbi:MAG: glycoside hydrolase family 2 [Clostridia bacterium]|nr:glycoside hydrolase family 2 [Clostridia bacterium]
MKENRSYHIHLNTEFEEELENSEVPFSEYPRPNMRRRSYLCLNGEWQFKIINKNRTIYDGKILVPFPPESRISGVFKNIDKKDILIYERTFSLDKTASSHRVILNIGACDQYARVFINGIFVGDHEGGYIPFSFDISDFVSAKDNTIRIEAHDPLCLDLPYGKQTTKRGGMWYTKISGIWQTVWLEEVPENYIKDIKITPDLSGVDIRINGGATKKTLSFNENKYEFEGDHFRLDVSEPHLWSPEDPFLYEFDIYSGEDKISSYFGLRTVSIKNRNGIPLIYLNNEPIFCHGVLDQGYFSDGIFIPASPNGFLNDIIQMKKCGFNTLRKHIKLEPQLFYYYCDKYGMLVFQDMINSGKYNFLIDTALPTVFLKKGVSHRASKRRKKIFLDSCHGIIENLYSHPSVVYYTIFNEGWGQFSPKEIYSELKKADPERIYDTTSGWFKTDATDVESDHVYFKPVKLKPIQNKPMVLSEFGGYAYKVKEHSFNLRKTYGYRKYESREEFENALCELYKNEIIEQISDGLCAAILTQLSDVEDETNGLLTYDRRTLKVDCNRMHRLSMSLFKKFQEAHNINNEQK